MGKKNPDCACHARRGLACRAEVRQCFHESCGMRQKNDSAMRSVSVRPEVLSVFLSMQCLKRHDSEARVYRAGGFLERENLPG